MVYTPKNFILDEDFYNRHITFTSVRFITEIANKLKDLGITYFTFDRVYNDGSHIKLTNSGKWTKHYYSRKLYEFSIFERNPYVFNNGVILWSWLSQDPIYIEAALYNINYGLTIVEQHNTYCNFYHFGTDQDTPESEAIIYSKLNLLHKFIALFNHEAHHIIKKAELTKIILPIDTEFDLDDVVAAKDTLYTVQDKIKRLYLGDKFNNNYLTNKELQILAYLYSGKRLVDIAIILFISKKTIETHIENIKAKLNCKTMFELGAIAHNIGIYNFKIE